MNKLSAYIYPGFLAITLVICASCAHTETKLPDRIPSPSDTVYTKKAAMEAMATDPDRALSIIDSAVLAGNVSAYRADFLRMKVYTQSLNGMQLDSAKAIARRLSQHDSLAANPSDRLTLLDLGIAISRISLDDERLLKFTREKADLCRELNDEVEALRTDVERGVMLVRLGHSDQGMKLLDSVIDRLDGVRRFNEMDTWIIALRRKINILEDIPGSSDLIIKLSQRMLTRLEDYSKNPEVYRDGSSREPDDDERPSYIDFYQSKCYAYLAEANIGIDQDVARSYLELYEQTGYGKTYNGRIMIATVLCRLGEYDKMESVYREMDSRNESSDTVNTLFLSMLHDRAVAAEAQGRTQDALSLWKRYDALKGIVSKRTISGKAHFYAAGYKMDEEGEGYGKNRKSTILKLTWFLGILALVFFCFIVINHIRHNWKIDVGPKKEILLTEPAKVPQKRPGAMNDRELFLYISDIIRREQLFLNPMLDRQAIMNRVGGLSAHRVGAAFSKGSEFRSLPGYVRILRLEYACALLISRPDMSVKAVGEASGFSNNSTFCSDFRAQYGITPSDYRQAKMSK